MKKKSIGKNCGMGAHTFCIKADWFLIGSPSPIGLTSHNQQHVYSLSLARWWTEPRSSGMA